MRELLVAAVLAAAACGGSSRPADVVPASTGLVEPGSARPGDRTWCIVTGEEFTVTEASPKIEHGGKTYYFCCAGCDKDFAKEPSKYVGRPRPAKS